MSRRERKQQAATARVLLALTGGNRWGCDLSLSTRLRPAVLYPTLARLEADGLVRSEWDDSTPRRRIYFIAGET